MKPVYIYALVDPETDQIRYIGKSIRPKERLQNHMNEKSNCHRSHWLQSLKKKGLKPHLVIIEEIYGAWPWQESERYWIAYARKHDWPLTNNTSGGDGVSGLPKETREKIRQTWLGRKHSPESIQRIREAVRGRKHTEEHKQKMRRIMSNRDITWGDKISESLRRFTKTQQKDIRERISSGEKVIDLAKEFGVHRTTISKIKKGTYEQKKAKK